MLRTTSPPRGTPAPTMPVLPPCGTTAAPCSRQAREHGGDLRGVGRAHDGARGAAVAPVQSISKGARTSSSASTWRVADRGREVLDQIVGHM